MLGVRAEQILKAAVREFIQTGEPVSSERLYERYDFGIKPAMIRLELNDLSDKGYFTQPHHAAGRVPTDRGYEFYVQDIVSGDLPGACDRDLANLFERRAWPEFLTEFSSELNILGATSVFPEKTVYKSMLTNLIDRLDWPTSELRGLIHDFEDLDERLRAMQHEVYEDVRVFIGRKSPITKSENLAVMAARYDSGGSRVVVCAIGPKQMDYKRTARVMKGLKRANSKGQAAKDKQR